MDPCPFVRVTVGNLALKITAAAKPARSAVHPSSSPCFCLIQLKGFPPETAVVPYIPPESTDANWQTHATNFHLSKSDLDKLTGKSSLFSTSNKPCLKISVYSGRRGPTCGLNSGRLLEKISLPLDLTTAESSDLICHNGWINVGKETKRVAQFHLNVKAEPEPRFVFQFDGEPECSPQISKLEGLSGNRFSLASSVFAQPTAISPPADSKIAKINSLFGFCNIVRVRILTLCT